MTNRLRLPRDAWVLLLLLLALVAFSSFVAWRRSQLDEANNTYVPYSTHSANENGMLALYTWIERLGYQPHRIENQKFQVDDRARLLLVMAPINEITPGQAQSILDWVSHGNVLFTTTGGLFARNGLLQALDVTANTLDPRVERALLTQPLTDSALQEVEFNTLWALALKRDDYVEYASAQGKPLLVRLAYGEGSIWLASSPELLSNGGLRDEDNARFAQVLLGSVPRGSVIAFDEYHLGFNRESVNSLLTLIYDTPWGWGLLFAFLVIFAYLVLNGRRFGRVVPVQRTLARRTPSEYVVSMANLFRRANKRGMILDHYRYSLKRRLGRPFHLKADLPDERYIELVARLRPDLDRAELSRILGTLRRSDASEADLIKTVEQAVTFDARPKKATP